MMIAVAENGAARLCKQANVILTKYESNVFFVFVTCVFYNLA